MLKPFSLIFFVAVMLWLGSIVVTTKPEARMDRGCFPVELVDRTLTSTLLLVHASWAPEGHELFQKWTNGCKFVVWKLFYESDWMEQNGITKPPLGGAASSEEAMRLQRTSQKASGAASPASAPKAGFGNSNEFAKQRLDKAAATGEGTDNTPSQAALDAAAQARQKADQSGAGALGGVRPAPAPSYFEGGR